MKTSKGLGKYIIVGSTHKLPKRDIERLDQDTQKFLASGKQIQQIPPGVSALGHLNELHKVTLADRLKRFGPKEST
jgi:hypothetical protein